MRNVNIDINVNAATKIKSTINALLSESYSNDRFFFFTPLGVFCVCGVSPTIFVKLIGARRVLRSILHEPVALYR